MNDRGYRRAAFKSARGLREIEAEMRVWLTGMEDTDPRRVGLSEALFGIRGAAQMLTAGPEFRAQIDDHDDVPPPAPAEAVLPTAEDHWGRGNAISQFEQAALAAAEVNSGEFDDRDWYDVDGGLEHEGGINQVILPPRPLSAAQEALFRVLIIRMHNEVIGPRPSDDEVFVLLADVQLVAMLQNVIRGVVALPHDQRVDLAHWAVDKLEAEERTRRSGDAAPQRREHLVAFARQVAEDINEHTARSLKSLRPQEAA